MAKRLSCSLIGLALAIDGDTLQILPADEGCRVRLWGVEAPEAGDEAGRLSRDALALLISGGVDCTDTRGMSYERVVARCTLQESALSDVAAELVRQGHAADWPAYSEGAYADAEAEARRHGRGMWGD